MNNYLCETCGPITATHVADREQTLPVKGEPITVVTPVRLCDTCGGTVYDRDLDNQTLTQAYDAYRQHHSIFSPEDIAAIRAQYNLSQRNLAVLMGLGEVTITRYENGSLPDEAHNQLLRFVRDPWNMKSLFALRGSRLSPSAQQKLSDTLDRMIGEGTAQKLVELVSTQPKHCKPSLNTGSRDLSPTRLMEMLMFFSHVADKTYRTKLNKLLWYSDFAHYRRHSVSISGSTYIHMPYGPVVEDYDIYIKSLLDEADLVEEEEFLDDGKSVCALRATRPPDETVFPATAWEVMAEVKRTLGDKTSKVLSELSHEEDAYQKTATGEPIPYPLAETLRHI